MPRPLHDPFRTIPLIAALAGALLAAIGSADAGAVELFAGGFSFSDELGGFRLVSASGEGTAGDPIVVVEEIEEVAPITLVIRRRFRLDDPMRPGYAPLVLEKVVVNRSLRVWAGFEIELQEILRRPSVYGDGLSFNQFGAQPPDVTADSFADNERLYEPYDRIRFSNGHVDPEATVRFRFIITDPTPLVEFYLVQDPKLLSVGLPVSRSLARLD
jgi:hypothetical protein